MVPAIFVRRNVLLVTYLTTVIVTFLYARRLFDDVRILRDTHVVHCTRHN